MTRQILFIPLRHNANVGFDPVFGARPVKRVIQREVQDRLADMILAGEVMPEQVVELDLEGKDFKISPIHTPEIMGADTRDPVAGEGEA